MKSTKLFTIGFTKKTAERFFTLLDGAGVRCVVDIRLSNASQLAGFAKKDDLQYFLKNLCNIDYVHILELAPTRDILDAFKKHGGSWEAFEKEFLTLLSERRVEERISKTLLGDGCLLCSEAHPEKCHRRLVAQYFRDTWPNMEIVHLG